MTGKQKCKILKEIRRQIAEANDIRFVVEECTHQGKCKGTCPRCEWEVRELEKALEKRRLSGKKVALAGISAGMIVSSATACSPVETIRSFFGEVQGNMELEGDILVPETDTQTEIIEPLMGDPVPESAISIPGEIVEETAVGEVVTDLDGLIMPPVTETDEEWEHELAGVPIFTEATTPVEDEWDTEEYILTGSTVPPDTEEETE